MSLPKGTDEEKAARKQAMNDATKVAIEVPFKVMQLSYDSMEVIKAMAGPVIQILFQMRGWCTLCTQCCDGCFYECADQCRRTMMIRSL
jgi:hypothetical protein